jgi:hypothetical protein
VAFHVPLCSNIVLPAVKFILSPTPSPKENSLKNKRQTFVEVLVLLHVGYLSGMDCVLMFIDIYY